MPLTDPVSVLLAVVAAAIAGLITWVQWPRPPALDGERWFKVILATLLRGRAEATGGDVAAWEAAVLRWVPYHPAGRFPERKISNPVAASIAGAALPGEVALVEALARLPGEPEPRWARLYDEDEGAIEARLVDPADLGEDYDPATTLGLGASWDALAAWGAHGADPDAEGASAAFHEAIHRVVARRWILVEGRPGLLGGPSLIPALAEVIGPLAERIPHGSDRSELAVRLHEWASQGPRLVLVGEEAGIPQLLRLLAEDMALREQVSAVVSIGGVIGGRSDERGPLGEATCKDWLDAWFGQNTLDTEVVRLTPYFAVQWLDRTAWPPGVPGLPLQAARFPDPHTRAATATTLEVVDLGPLPADPELPTALVARALVAVVSAWIVHRS